MAKGTICWRCKGMGMRPADHAHRDGYHLMIQCGPCKGTGQYPPPKE